MVSNGIELSLVFNEFIENGIEFFIENGSLRETRTTNPDRKGFCDIFFGLICIIIKRAEVIDLKGNGSGMSATQPLTIIRTNRP